MKFNILGWDDDDEEDEQPQIKTTQGPYRGNETQSRSQPISDGNNPSKNNFEVQSKKKVNPTTEYALLQCDYNFIAKQY